MKRRSKKRQREPSNSDGDGDKKDRLSELPDSLIHLILSLLPSTKFAVRTSILSRRWRYMWTCVPSLAFTSEDFLRVGQPKVSDLLQFAGWVDRTLSMHSSPKIKRFCLDFDLTSKRSEVLDWRINLWIHCVIRKGVEDLKLMLLRSCLGHTFYLLPPFVYSSDSLSELRISDCKLLPVRRVSWSCLKVLHLRDAYLTEGAIEGILSGSPVLESLSIHRCCGFSKIDIVSTSLKELFLYEMWESGPSWIPACHVEISAPHLEVLNIFSCWCDLVEYRLIDYSSSLETVSLNFHVMLDLNSEDETAYDAMCQDIVKDLLDKVQHANSLEIGTWCIQILSMLEVRGLSLPSSDHRSLVLHVYHPKNCFLPGLANLLRSSPKLEKLIVYFSSIYKAVITELETQPEDFRKSVDFEDLWDSQSLARDGYHNSIDLGEDYLTVKGRVSLLHLKTIEIFGLEKELQEGEKLAFGFLEFLLKNARALEEVFIAVDTCRLTESSELSRTLLSFPRSSPHAKILIKEVVVPRPCIS